MARGEKISTKKRSTNPSNSVAREIGVNTDDANVSFPSPADGGHNAGDRADPTLQSEGNVDEASTRRGNIACDETTESDEEDAEDVESEDEAETVPGAIATTPAKNLSLIEEIREAVKGKTVAIVAMGSSNRDFVEASTFMGNPHRYADEIWALNSTMAVFRFDRAFMLDPAERFFEPNAKTVMGDSGPMSDGMRMFLENYDGNRPIYTCILDQRVKGLRLFPVKEVVEALDTSYFNSTVSYMIATAILAEVKTIKLSGVDFSYSNTHVAESGRACCEFWLATAMARGIKVDIAKSSSLLDTNVSVMQKLYGYHRLKDPYVPVIDEDGKHSVRLLSELKEILGKNASQDK